MTPVTEAQTLPSTNTSKTVPLFLKQKVKDNTTTSERIIIVEMHKVDRKLCFVIF